MKTADPGAACPCGRTDTKGRALALERCCGPYLRGAEAAPDGETLMRSRYSAFVLQDADYLLATWHPRTRPPRVDFDLGTKWLGLQVRDHRATGADRAEVEFVARWRVGGRAVRLHERSRFEREAGRWFYIDGDMLE